MVDRPTFLLTCLELQGAPYQWGAKGPDAYDCSGLVTVCLHACSGPDWRQTHNAQRLWDELEPTTEPQSGDFVFYGRKGKVNHVMVLWPDGRVYGACGGDHTTTTLEDAKRRGACVQFRSGPSYRFDLLGYRKLPEAGDTHG